MATTKGYTAIQSFKRNGRWVRPGTLLNLSDKEALYLSLEGKVERKETGDRRQEIKDKARKPAPKKSKKPKKEAVNKSTETTADELMGEPEAPLEEKPADGQSMA